MSTNLLETVQTQMGYPALQKIDPNTQMVTADNSTPDEHLFSQAAIPGILTALYKYSRTDEGAENILQGTISTDWLDILFGDNKKSVIQKIAFYSNFPGEITEIKLNTIAVNAVNNIKKKVPAEATIHDVKKFLADQSPDILLYLPASLQMGEILNDNTLDDRTNKMEGPLSSLMRGIGGKFSDDEPVKKDAVERM